MPMRTLLIDNYDSYTYNLYHLIAAVNGEPPVVVYNDEVNWDELERVLAAGSFDSVVISPGPGTPECAADIGVCLPLLRTCSALPVLGVCLGHQALGVAHGARVVRAPEPRHGRLSDVVHDGHALFADIPSGAGFGVVRYHSLVVDVATLPACLTPTAWTADAADGSGGVLMALSHASWPHHGVQFHPESVATAHGDTLLRNFRTLTQAHWAAAGRSSNTAPAWTPPHSCGPLARQPAPACLPALQGDAVRAGTRLLWRCMPGGGAAGTDALFWQLFAPTEAQEADTWWLDSATTADGRARFSFMGGRGGPLWRRVSFRLDAPGSAPAADGTTGTASVLRAGGVAATHRTELFRLVEAELAEARCATPEADWAALPFEFWGGWVGFFGYELRAECAPRGAPQRHASATPDAALFFADRLLAVDHESGDVYALALVPAVPAGGAADADATAWLDAMQRQIAALAAAPATAAPRPAAAAPAAVFEGCAHDAPAASFALRRGRAEYVADVAATLEAIRAGETYEVCLTTALERAQAGVAPRALYTALRACNPAPYAAWLRFGGGDGGNADADALTVCCSSPERFLRLDRNGVLEAKPIKGTAPRALPHGCAADAASGAALSASVKDRAENLMIVDLLRNDLGRVCALGSVCVPALCALESYATVHQLVSTVRGTLQPGVSCVAALRAAFPGGSMTGAPKVRTCALIDALEPGARGVYSGALGFLSVNGTADLNIVIRTAVLHAGRIAIGAGGAIVTLSDAAGEYDEMRLKARAVLAAVAAADAAPVL